MKQTKICPYCKETFTTEKNSKKYCRKKCADAARKRMVRPGKSHLCQWCGQIYTAQRKLKFCSVKCRHRYMKELGLLQKTTFKIPVKITLVDADRQSKAEGVTYGTYVRLHKLS